MPSRRRDRTAGLVQTATPESNGRRARPDSRRFRVRETVRSTAALPRAQCAEAGLRAWLSCAAAREDRSAYDAARANWAGSHRPAAAHLGRPRHRHSQRPQLTAGERLSGRARRRAASAGHGGRRAGLPARSTRSASPLPECRLRRCPQRSDPGRARPALLRFGCPCGPARPRPRRPAPARFHA